MMNIYSLSKDKVPDHLQRIIIAVQEVLREKAYDFILIGAAARDVIFDGIYSLGISRHTNDVDFALYVPEWDGYEALMTLLTKSGKFNASGIYHRLLFENSYEVDIVPFGGIQDEKGQYLWPPENLKLMTVIGFMEVNKGGLVVKLQEKDLQFRVASIAGICAMKLLAWKDRKYDDTRDGKDLGFMLSKYGELKLDVMYDEYQDIIEDPAFDLIISGARILGRDIGQLLGDNQPALDELLSIISSESEDEKTSLLATAMRQGGITSFEIAFTALTQLKKGMKEAKVSPY